MTIAILDLGTNTFNLLIAERSNIQPFEIIHNEILPVKLGRGGISKNVILDDAMDRAFYALNRHQEAINKYKVSAVYAFATSAVRTAINGKEFAEKIKERYGWELKIISGDKEAELIYYGVRASLKKFPDRFLILDIGGGSNEFIIGDAQQILWKQSFPLGIARLIESFPPSDPVTKEQIIYLERYLISQLIPLFEAYNKFSPSVFIGSSGTFDTILALLRIEMSEKYPVLMKTFSSPISLDDFKVLYRKILASTIEQRQHMKGLDQARVEMIVYAMIFVNFVVERLSIQEFFQSDFSLREGAAWCIFNGVNID